jgi:hypothetical protein
MVPDERLSRAPPIRLIGRRAGLIISQTVGFSASASGNSAEEPILALLAPRLQAGGLPGEPGYVPIVIVYGFFDFSLYLDADHADLEVWYAVTAPAAHRVSRLIVLAGDKMGTLLATNADVLVTMDGHGPCPRPSRPYSSPRPGQLSPPSRPASYTQSDRRAEHEPLSVAPGALPHLGEPDAGRYAHCGAGRLRGAGIVGLHDSVRSRLRLPEWLQSRRPDHGGRRAWRSVRGIAGEYVAWPVERRATARRLRRIRGSYSQGFHSRHRHVSRPRTRLGCRSCLARAHLFR